MKRDNINYFMVGSFVLLMLLVLLFSFYKITGRGADSDEYHVYYERVSGIRVGTTVTYGGFEVGQLLDIEPERENNNTRYKLTLGVKSGWDIPADSTARVVSPGLLAENQIEINEGNSDTLLKPGETIKGIAAVDMMAMINALSGDFHDLADTGLKPILANINRQITQIGDGNLAAITKDTRKLVASLTISSNQLNKLLSDENTARIEKVITNSDVTMTRLATLAERLEQSSANIKKLVDNSNEIVSGNKNDIRQAVIDLRNSLNSVTQHMETIMYNLDTASRDISEFSHQIRSNPGVLLNSKPPKDERK